MSFSKNKDLDLTQSKLDLLELLLEDEGEAPLTLHNFKNYLITKESSIENLEFLMFVNKYKTQYFKLPIEKLNQSPPMNNHLTPLKLQSRPNLVLTKKVEADFTSEKNSGSKLMVDDVTISFDNVYSKNLNVKYAPDAQQRTQPMRESIDQLVQLFLTVEGKYELNLSELLLKQTLLNLTKSTHPTSFSDVELEIKHLLAYNSLPKFINLATQNFRHKNYYFNRAIISTLLTVVGLIYIFLCIWFRFGLGYKLFGLILFTVGMAIMAQVTSKICLVNLILKKRQPCLPGESNCSIVNFNHRFILRRQWLKFTLHLLFFMALATSIWLMVFLVNFYPEN